VFFLPSLSYRNSTLGRKRSDPSRARERLSCTFVLHVLFFSVCSSSVMVSLVLLFKAPFSGSTGRLELDSVNGISSQVYHGAVLGLVYGALSSCLISRIPYLHCSVLPTPLFCFLVWMGGCADAFILSFQINFAWAAWGSWSELGLWWDSSGFCGI